MGWRRVAEEELPTLEPETRQVLQAYADGVNRYLRGRSPGEVSAEYTVLGLQLPLADIEEWTPVDSLVLAQGDGLGPARRLQRRAGPGPAHRTAQPGPDHRDLPGLRRATPARRSSRPTSGRPDGCPPPRRRRRRPPRPPPCRALSPGATTSSPRRRRRVRRPSTPRSTRPWRRCRSSWAAARGWGRTRGWSRARTPPRESPCWRTTPTSVSASRASGSRTACTAAR